MKKWKTLKSKIVYSNQYFKVWADDVQVNSHQVDYYFLERNNFSLIIPVKDNNFIMVKQYRYAIKRESLEFPMGGCEGGENYAACAKRELLEEAGVTAKQLFNLGEVAPTPGHSCQMFNVFLATGLTEVGHQNRDQLEEDMEIHKIKISDFPKLVKSGEIVDGPTTSAYALYQISNIKNNGAN